MEREQIWTHIEQQRLRLADLFDTVSDDQWALPSLCRGWTIHHVAGHASFPARWRHLSGTVAMARAGFSFNRMIDADANARVKRPPAELVQELRDLAGSRTHPLGTQPVDPLVDIQVHSLDVAVPLGVDWTLPPDAAAAAADRVWRMPFPFFAKRRLGKYRLKAVNADWEAGRGGEVIEEPIEDLLLRLTGRR